MVAISSQIDIDIDRQQLLHNIGYRADCEPSARIESLINEYVENVCHLIEPSYSYVFRDINLVHGSRIVIEGSVTFHGEILARLAAQCERAVVFLVTIGGRLEEMVRHLAEEGLVLQATVLDAVGSGVVETVADFVQDMIGEVARSQGLRISRRFSPGYCDWEVSQQRMLFRAMNGDCAGIRLTDGYLMLPQKSVSGIIGIGQNSSIEDYNPCKTCKERDCLGRR